MDREHRRARIEAYKERKVTAGIFAVRCAPSGEAWVGRAPDLATIWRRISFELAQGSSRRASLQAAWQAHGASALAFEVVEAIDEEVAYVRDTRLAARLDHWRATLDAKLA